jgi:hypothetical protein
MEFAILPAVERGSPAWQVVQLATSEDSRALPVRLTSFGERAHAEAFLNDLFVGLAGEFGRMAYEAA